MLRALAVRATNRRQGHGRSLVEFIVRHAYQTGVGRMYAADLLGATAGIHTQPASLAKARELTQSDLVFITYATTYPIGMIGKIILAQILLILSQ